MNYLLVGSEEYNLKKRRDEIIKKNIDDEFNLNVIKGDQLVIQELLDDCMTPPFFADQKVIVVENPSFLLEDDEDITALTDYLKKPSPFTVLIFYVNAAVNRRKSIFTELTKLMQYEKYDTLAPADFRHVVNKSLSDNGISLDYRAKEELLSRLPVDLSVWRNELTKLVNYPGRLDQETIKLLVSKPLEEDVFQLTNAVVGRKMSDAISIYRDLMTMNKNDAASLIGLLAYQFRFMSQVRALNEMGMTMAEIADHYKCKEYRVQMTLKGSTGTTSKDLLAILSRLSDLDQSIKAGEVDAKLGLELFIMNAVRR